MKRETVLEKLQSVRDGADPDEVLKWLMDENGSDIEREKSRTQAKSEEGKALKERLDELQAQLDEASRKSMTDEEQLAKAKKDYEDKLADLNVKSNRIEAKRALADAGLLGDEADAILDRIVTPDKDATDGTVKALVAAMGLLKETVETETKQAMLQSVPKPSASFGNEGHDQQSAYMEAEGRNDLVGMAAAIRAGFQQSAVKD